MSDKLSIEDIALFFEQKQHKSAKVEKIISKPNVPPNIGKYLPSFESRCNTIFPVSEIIVNNKESEVECINVANRTFFDCVLMNYYPEYQSITANKTKIIDDFIKKIVKDAKKVHEKYDYSDLLTQRELLSRLKKMILPSCVNDNIRFNNFPIKYVADLLYINIFVINWIDDIVHYYGSEKLNIFKQNLVLALKSKTSEYGYCELVTNQIFDMNLIQQLVSCKIIQHPPNIYKNSLGVELDSDDLKKYFSEYYFEPIHQTNTLSNETLTSMKLIKVSEIACNLGIDLLTNCYKDSSSHKDGKDKRRRKTKQMLIKEILLHYAQ